MTAFTQQKRDPEPMRSGRQHLATGRRCRTANPDANRAPTIVGGRLARIEVRRLGYDEAVMLNDVGRVAETSGACILIADEGRVITPPASEGCLDSITVDALERVEHASAECRSNAGRLSAPNCWRRKSAAIAGTITALTIVSEVDGFQYEQAGVLAGLRDRYIQLMRGDLVLPGVEMLPLICEPAQAVSH